MSSTRASNTPRDASNGFQFAGLETTCRICKFMQRPTGIAELCKACMIQPLQ